MWTMTQIIYHYHLYTFVSIHLLYIGFYQGLQKNMQLFRIGASVLAVQYSGYLKLNCFPFFPHQILVAIEQVQDLLPKIERSRSEPSLHRAVHAEDLNPLLFHTTRLMPL